ncbi:MAG: asparaginase domain-containing protein, partial [Sharpea porci]
MKKIVVIATGGTIAGSGEAGKTADYRAGTIKVEEVLASIPQVKDIANIEMIQLLSVDSNEMNEQHWLALLDMINKQASRDDVDGIVVTHGTDTLEETAYFLNLTVHTVKPVVLTGAMRPATATSADGPFNLYQAIALAANDKAIGCGIMALFSSTIYSARG